MVNELIGLNRSGMSGSCSTTGPGAGLPSPVVGGRLEGEEQGVRLGGLGLEDVVDVGGLADSLTTGLSR